MHTKAISEKEGEFNNWVVAKISQCRKCESPNVKYREWESSCGGYDDYQFKCTDCGYKWWVEGPDA